MPRTGIVVEAAVDVLAAGLSVELRLEQSELRRIAARQADQLVAAGFRVTVPVEALATARRRRASSETTT
ncbi:hypothetical protein ACIQPR_18350 [Streptomyces sp. NPDC091280]|uniref:hypothetical protein n=1 Tax=Streptomyces sp. NPDC091280 TaxID=3365984 RepID=UPI003804610C